MEILYTFFRFIYVIIFFGALYISLRFEWGSEGKDERGKTIANKSYGIIFPLLPLGWLALEMVDKYFLTLDYETYKLLIWFLLTGLMIIHALNLIVLKKKY